MSLAPLLLPLRLHGTERVKKHSLSLVLENRWIIVVNYCYYYYYSMSERGNTCWKIENSFSFWSEKKGEGIDYDWGGSIERGGGGGEKKAQRGGWRVSKGERKKLTDATCLKGGVWGRSRRGLSRCVESSWVVGNNKFYARLSLSFSTFKFNIWIILNWHFSILLFSLFSLLYRISTNY